MIEINNKKLCESCFAEVEEEGKCPHCGFSKEEFEPDALVLPMGTKLQDKILIGRVMGKGGFGITYLGYDLRMEKTIAVKEYYPNGIAYRSQSGTEVLVANANTEEAFEKGTEKFYAEAEMVAQFNGNPNIVGVYDYFRENNTVYLIMEYLNGVTLKNYVKKHGKISNGQALFVMDKMAAALSITHSAGVLHRDISPDNIMICLDGKVKLIDFGAARQIVAESSSNLTVVLKPGYTPIEQYTKKGKQGAWTDIHALGASIYYAMTGKVIDDPYERMEKDTEFESNIHGINDTLWNVIKKCTMINAQDRYGNAIELRKALAGVSAPLKAEPIALCEDDVKISAAEQVGEIRVSLTKQDADPVQILGSRDAEEIESFSRPAVSEEEGYDPEVNVYEKVDAKPLNKRLIIGVTIAAGAVVIGTLLIWLAVVLFGGALADGSVQRMVIDDSDSLWASSKSITKEIFERFGSDVRVTLNIATLSDTGGHEYYHHSIRLLSDDGFFDNSYISTDNGVFNSTLGYDVYDGQETFTFTLSKESISSMGTYLGFSVTNTEIYSAVLEAASGDDGNEKILSFDENYPGEWSRYKTAISKSELLSYGGNVRIEVEYWFVAFSGGYIKTVDEIWYPVPVNAPNVMPEDGEAVYKLDSYININNNNTFVYIITEEQINSLTDSGLYFQVSGISVHSVTLKSWPYEVASAGSGAGANAGDDGGNISAKSVVLTDFLNEYPGDYETLGVIPKDELESFDGDIRVTFDLTTGFFDGYDEPWWQVILAKQNDLWSNIKDVYDITTDDSNDHCYGIPYGTTEFVIVIPGQLVQTLDEDIFLSGHDILINSVTLEDAEAAAANDPKEPRTEPTVFEYPGEYTGDWNIAAGIMKRDLEAYESDVKVTVEIETVDADGTNFYPCIRPFWKFNTGDWVNGTDLVTGDHLRLGVNMYDGVDVFYELNKGDTVFTFYMTRENIQKLTGTGLGLNACDVIIKRITITPMLTYTLNTSPPRSGGNWYKSGNIRVSSFSPYFTDDIKVVLELEYVDNELENIDNIDHYFRGLNIFDASGKNVILNAFNLAICRESPTEAGFYIGGYLAGLDGQTYDFEFVLSQEDVENIDGYIDFASNNCFVRTVTFEAYCPAEDAVSANAKTLLLGVSRSDEYLDFTTFIPKNELEDIGGDVRIVLDISGELFNSPGNDGIAHIFPINSANPAHQFPLYARNHETAEVHAYYPEYDFSADYPLGYWTHLPEQIDFVITEEQIQELGSDGLYFGIQNANISAAHLEAA